SVRELPWVAISQPATTKPSVLPIDHETLNQPIVFSTRAGPLSAPTAPCTLGQKTLPVRPIRGTTRKRCLSEPTPTVSAHAATAPPQAKRASSDRETRSDSLPMNRLLRT